MIADSTNFELTDELKEKIKNIIAAHDYDFTQIVGILVEVQQEIPQHYIPKIVAYYIAENLPDVKVSVIYDCITFYDALSDKPRGRYPIEVCDNIACKVNNNQFLIDTLQKLLNIGFDSVTYDGRFILEKVSCFGACDKAPAVRINGQVYGNLDSEEKIRALLEKFI